MKAGWQWQAEVARGPGGLKSWMQFGKVAGSELLHSWQQSSEDCRQAEDLCSLNRADYWQVW